MNFFTKTFAALTLLVALPAQATIVTVDGIAKNDVDVLVTIGGNNWLQVTETNGFSFDNFDSIFNTSTGACINPIDPNCSVNSTNSEGESVLLNLSGFTWALSSEVEALINGAGFDLLNSGFTVYDPDNTTSSGDEYLDGLTRNGNLVGEDSSGKYSDPFTDYGSSSDSFGGWFYKSTAVPEPSVIALFSIGLIGLGLTRRRKSK